MRQQPLLDVGRLVGRVVVQDQVNLQAGRDFLVQFREELLELRRPVAAVKRSDDLAGGDFEGGEEGRGAGANQACSAGFGSIGTSRSQ